MPYVKRTFIPCEFYKKMIVAYTIACCLILLNVFTYDVLMQMFISYQFRFHSDCTKSVLYKMLYVFTFLYKKKCVLLT